MAGAAVRHAVSRHLTQLGGLPIAFESWAHVQANRFCARGRCQRAGGLYGQPAKRATLRRTPARECYGRARGGWAKPLFDKLDADIAWAMMGINAVKGVEIGVGFASVAQRGGVRRR